MGLVCRYGVGQQELVEIRVIVDHRLTLGGRLPYLFGRDRDSFG